MIFHMAFSHTNNLMVVRLKRELCGLGKEKKSSCILNVLRRFTACQIRVPFVMRRRHSVSFPARYVHVQMPVHVCGQKSGHAPHTLAQQQQQQEQQSSLLSLDSSPMVSPKDISIFITLAEVIKENYEEEEEGKNRLLRSLGFIFTYVKCTFTHIHTGGRHTNTKPKTRSSVAW